MDGSLPFYLESFSIRFRHHCPLQYDICAGLIAEQGCLATWDAFIADALDADWFVLDASDGACPLTEELTLVTDTPLELCMVPRCAWLTRTLAVRVPHDGDGRNRMGLHR